DRASRRERDSWCRAAPRDVGQPAEVTYQRWSWLARSRQLGEDREALPGGAAIDGEWRWREPAPLHLVVDMESHVRARKHLGRALELHFRSNQEVVYD